MNRTRTSSVAVVSAVMLLAGSFVYAQEKTKPSRVFGVVTTAAGAPAKTVEVKLTAQGQDRKGGVGGGGGPGRRGRGETAGNYEPTPLMAKVIAGKSDDKGNFDFKSVPPGLYELEAGRPATVGYASAMVNIDGEGKDQQVNLQLSEPVRD